MLNDNAIAKATPPQHSNCYSLRMDINKLRVKSLLELQEKHGSQKNLAIRLDCTPGYIGQLLSGHRPITEKNARKIETTLSLSPRWMDTPHSSEVGTLSGNAVQITHKDGSSATIRKIPVISTTTAGGWGEVVDSFEPGYAERWIDAPDTVSEKAFALVIIGKSMLPTIPDGATVIVDPTAEYHHNSIVIVRQNGNKEATCKRLSYEGSTPYLIPDNEQFGKPELLDDAVIVGVVKQAVIDL